MDFIRPIGPVERDVDPVYRIERTQDERRRGNGSGQEETERQPPRPAPESPAATPEEPPQGPVEGDDGHLHIDIRA
jgi:hypothetical protein